MTPTPCSSGDFVEIVVVRHDLGVELLGQEDELDIDRLIGEFGWLVVVDLEIDFVVGKPVEDVQAARSAAARKRSPLSAMFCNSANTKRGMIN